MPSPTSKTSAPRHRPQIKQCFIAAAWNVDLAVVKATLHERGIKPIVPRESTSLYPSLLAQVRESIKQADLFLAILSAETMPDNILFELGCAYAFEKTTLIMTPPGAILPADLRGLPVIRADAQNKEALGFALDQALAPKRASTQRKQSVQETHALGHKAEELLTKLHSTRAEVREADLLKLIATALNESGASSVVEQGPRERGFDMAVWSDDLGPWIGNPLLIEVKTHLPTTRNCEHGTDTTTGKQPVKLGASRVP